MSLYFLSQIISNFTYQPLIELIILVLLGYKIHIGVQNLILNPIKSPSSYSFKWSFRNFWDDYPELISKQSKIAYAKIESEIEESQVLEDELKKKGKIEGKSLVFKKIEGLKKTIKNTSNFLNVKNYFNSDTIKYQNEHKKISKALGFLTYDDPDDLYFTNQSPLFLIKETYFDFINQPISKKITKIDVNYTNNLFREIILSYLEVKLINFSF